MCKFLWPIVVLGMMTVPGHSQVVQPGRNLPPANYYPPPGHSNPPQGYAQPRYPQASPIGPQYPPGPWKSYYNDPQWQQDWRAYMQTKGTTPPERSTFGYPVQRTLPEYGSPNYRSYYSDPEWQQDWREYMDRQPRR